jgi:hypothetical protein
VCLCVCVVSAYEGVLEVVEVVLHGSDELRLKLRLLQAERAIEK